VKLVVLAAGYATRLYPLTLDRPKPLLPVGGRPMLERLLEKLADLEGIDGGYVVTNAKFAGQFEEWATAYSGPLRPAVVDDGTTSDEDRLGAIGDLALVVDREGIDDDLVVVAGDNLFSEPIGDFGREAAARRAPVVAVYDVGRLDEMSKYNAIELDGDGRITFFEEKPERPRSTLMAIALYFYPRETLPLLRRYLAEGNNPDQPGRLVEWLYVRVPFYTWQVPGVWYDIGSKETLAEADRAFAGEGPVPAHP
jgi:glucose-1-phosphate thymidylyltransferase